MRYLSCLAFVAALSGASWGLETVAAARRPAPAVTSAAHGLEKTLVECIAKAVPSFVFIGGGSGVVISADGLMLTNHHVARASKKWKVRLAGEKNFRDAKVLGYDPVGDVTLLKIETDGPLPFAEFGVSDELEVGTHVVAVGNPFGLAEFDGEPTVSFGVVSAVKSYQENYFDAIWTDAAVNPGNSGGPLLTLDGKLVGINGRIEPRFMTRSNTGIGYAISIDQIRRFLPSMKAANGKAVTHGRVRGLEIEMPERGDSSAFEWQNRVLTSPVVVKGTKAGSPAATAGFKPGDRIVAIDQYATFNHARYNSVLGAYPAGHKVTFTLKRPLPMPSTREKDVKIELTLEGQKSLGFGCRLAPARVKIPDEGQVIGLLVAAVPKGGPAEKAGLRRGDCVFAVDGRKLTTIAVVREIFGKLNEEREVGDEVPVRVYRIREKKKITLRVPLSSAFE